MEQSLPFTELSAKNERLLEDLYCQTALPLDELADTDDMDHLYQEFVRLTDLPLTVRDIYAALQNLDRVDRLSGKHPCVKCQALKLRVVKYFCPDCANRLEGLPPGTPRGTPPIVGTPDRIRFKRRGRNHLNSVDEDPDAYRPSLECNLDE
jgi:hypothetical protein